MSNKNHKIDLPSLRMNLHGLAEISGHEHKTSDFVAAFLQALPGWKIRRPIAKTGILATYDTGKKGPTVLFRAELDALPQATDHPIDGAGEKKALHLCGHDGHMTILLGLAERISHHPVEKGKILLLFQPAEETGSGALAVMGDAAFKKLNIDLMFALHNIPGETLNTVLVRDGSFSSTVQSLVLHLHGQEAHAAEPEKGRNPVYLINELIRLGRNLEQSDLHHRDYCQITPTYLQAGKQAHGTAAGSGEMHLTFRTHDLPNMERIAATYLNSAQRLAGNENIDIAYNWVEQFPSIVNHKDANAAIVRAGKKCGARVQELDIPFRWGEDFGQFTTTYKGAMFGIGAGKGAAPLHSGEYCFPDAIIEPAVGLLYAVISEI